MNFLSAFPNISLDKQVFTSDTLRHGDSHTSLRTQVDRCDNVGPDRGLHYVMCDVVGF